METEDPFSAMEARVKVEDSEMWQPPMLVLVPEFNTEDELCDNNEGGSAGEICDSNEGGGAREICDSNEGGGVVETEGMCGSDEGSEVRVADAATFFPVKFEPVEREDSDADGSGRRANLPKIVLTMSLSREHRALTRPEIPPSAIGRFPCSCGKVYLHRASLHKHVWRSKRGKTSGKGSRKRGRRKVEKAEENLEDVRVGHSGKVLKRKVKLASNEKVSLSSNSNESVSEVGNAAVNRQEREEKSGGKRRKEHESGVVHKAVNEGALQSGTGWYYCSCGKAFCYNSSLLKHIRVSTERRSSALKRKKRKEEDGGKPLKLPKSKGTVYKKEEKAQRGVPEGCVVSLADIINFCRTGNMDQPLQPDNFECFCGKIFPNMSSLIGHVHGSSKADPWHCLMSGELSQKSDMLSRYSELQSRPSGTVGKYHKCNVCNQWFAFLSNLRSHQLVHEEQKRKMEEKLNTKSKLVSEEQKRKMEEKPKTKSKLVHEEQKRKLEEKSKTKSKLVHEEQKRKLEEKSKTKSKSKSFQCNTCHRRFPLLSHLKSHQRTHEKENNIADCKYHECQVCGRQFPLLAHMKSHQRVHKNKETVTREPVESSTEDGARQKRFSLKEGTCSEETSVGQNDVESCKEKDGDVRGMIQEDSHDTVLPKKRARRSSLSLCSSDAATLPEEFSCHCGSLIKSASNILQHIEEHRMRQEFCCKECGKLFFEESLYERHCKHHQKSTCRVCNLTFRFYRDYAVHRLAHWGMIRVRCGRCGDKYNVRDLDTITYSCKRCEILMKGNGQEADKEVTAAVCKICHTSFQDFGELERHWLSHAGDCIVLLNRIEEMPKRSSEDCLKQREAHSSRGVECTQPASTPECVVNCVPENAGADHFVPVEKFQCQCQRPFRNLCHFKNHLCEFTGGILCTVCNKMFRKKTTLMKHMRRHTGLLRYKCNCCEKRFSRFRDLKNHKKTQHETTNEHEDQEVENSQENNVQVENCVQTKGDDDVKANDNVTEKSGNDSILSAEMDNVSVAKEEFEKISNVEVVNSVEELTDMENVSFSETVVGKELKSSFEGTVGTFGNQSDKGIHKEVKQKAFENTVGANCDSLKAENDGKILPFNVSKMSIAKTECVDREEVKLGEAFETLEGEKESCNSLEVGDGVEISKTERERTVLPCNISEIAVAKDECVNREEKLFETFETPEGEKKKCKSLKADCVNVEDDRRAFAVDGNDEFTRPADNSKEEQKGKGDEEKCAEGQFACNVCWKVFPDSEGLQVHKHVWGNVPCNLNRLQPSAQKRLLEVVNKDDENKMNVLEPSVHLPVANGEEQSLCSSPVKYKCSTCKEFFHQPHNLKAHMCSSKCRQLAIRYEITQVGDNMDQMQDFDDHMTVNSSNEFVTNPQSNVLGEMADSGQIKVIEDGKLVTKPICVTGGHMSLIVHEKTDLDSAQIVGGSEIVTPEAIVTGQKAQVNHTQTVGDNTFVSDQDSVTGCRKSEVNQEVGSNEKDRSQTPVIIYQPIIIPTIMPMIVNSSTSWGT